VLKLETGEVHRTPGSLVLWDRSILMTARGFYFVIENHVQWAWSYFTGYAGQSRNTVKSEIRILQRRTSIEIRNSPA
jgi:hypothetical protein